MDSQALLSSCMLECVLSSPQYHEGYQMLQFGACLKSRRYDGLMTEVSPRAGRPLSGPTGQLVAAHRDDLREVLARHGVKNARLFGSVARGEDHKGSDVDLLVQFAPGTSLFTVLRIQDELETILGVKVDLVPEGGLKERVRERVQPDLIAL